MLLRIFGPEQSPVNIRAPVRSGIVICGRGAMACAKGVERRVDSAKSITKTV
ncbi:hypothetical protein [Amycolatopsis sp. WGS_07]|uniref:hypothetical protein n=1 Tax=Amycolatopsis sp. WGS_07 TaxID=3076764 RepID=UPI0038734576